MLAITDISEFKKLQKKFHFYGGDDSRLFRFPDDEILNKSGKSSITDVIRDMKERGLL